MCSISGYRGTFIYIPALLFFRWTILPRVCVGECVLFQDIIPHVGIGLE
jgi:hypothetical protein